MKFTEHGQFVYVNRIPYLVGMAVISTCELYPNLKGRITSIETGQDSDLYTSGVAIHCTLKPPVTPDGNRRIEQLHTESSGYPQRIEDINFDDVALSAHEIRVILDHSMVAA